MQTLKEENEEWKKAYEDDGGKSYSPLNLTVEQKIHHKKLLNREWDFNLCVFCNKPISEIGGRKLVNTSSIKILIKNEPALEDINTHCIQIDTNEYLILKGTEWDNNSSRVVSLVKDGFTPWFCQVCGHKTCHKCGSPSQHIQGADLLDGSHCGIFPIQIGCVSRSCENHNPDWKKSVHIR